VVFTTDRSVRRVDVRRFKQVLVVFPHPDDEAVNCGGAINRLARAGASVTVLLLTLGERGNPSGTADPKLKAVRQTEAAKAAGILGVSRLIVEDLGDGRLDERRGEAGRIVATVIEAVKPDLIVTYDLAGLDGHSDHVACAEVVTELRTGRFPGVRLWYAAQPRRLVRLLKAAGQLATNESIDRRRAAPTIRIVIGTSVVPKIRAWYAHRSQRRYIAKGFGRLLPTWLAISLLQSEYFAEVD
jgi:LmbE family N-acetylglucosaminyl deacetylase